MSEAKMEEYRDGKWQATIPYPFFVRTIFGRWYPVCTKHKLIFKNKDKYFEHARTNDCRGGEILMSDHKRHLKGYKRDRL